MRIAFDHQTFTLQRYGGISRYFTRLARELIEVGEEVRVFAPFYQNRYLDELPAEAVAGRHLRGFPPKTTRAFLAFNRLASAPSFRRWRCDVVHETYYARTAAVARHAARILTVYDMTHEVCPEDFAANDPTSAMKRLAVARADHIICISRSTQRDLVELFGVDPRKTSAILLGVDPPSVPPVPIAGGGERPFLLFVGVRAGYKNFAGFLRAVAASRLLRGDVDVIAFGGGAFTPAEMALIDDLGLSGRVKQIVGDDRLLKSWYASAAMLVYPSRYEGFGLPPLEAMAHDCPVACSNTSSLPEVVGGAAALFDPADRADMIAAIENILGSPARSRDLIAKGRDRVRTLTWERCARQTLQVYRSAADSLT